MPPDKPPFRGCENPPKAFQHFSHQATAIQATAIHRFYRDSVSVAFRTAVQRQSGLAGARPAQASGEVRLPSVSYPTMTGSEYDRRGSGQPVGDFLSRIT